MQTLSYLQTQLVFGLGIEYRCSWCIKTPKSKITFWISLTWDQVGLDTAIISVRTVVKKKKYNN